MNALSKWMLGGLLIGSVACLGGCPTGQLFLPFIDADPTVTAGNEDQAGGEDDSASNVPPIVVAGEDITAEAGELIVLDGTGTSDPDKDRMIFFWQQVSGEPVDLRGRYSAVASFTISPELAEEAVYEFQLIVIDGTVAVTDEVEVTVTPQ